MIMSKKVVNNITKWNQVQEELSSGTAQASSGHNDASVDTAKPPINTAGRKDVSYLWYKLGGHADKVNKEIKDTRGGSRL